MEEKAITDGIIPEMLSTKLATIVNNRYRRLHRFQPCSVTTVDLLTINSWGLETSIVLPHTYHLLQPSNHLMNCLSSTVNPTSACTTVNHGLVTLLLTKDI